MVCIHYNPKNSSSIKDSILVLAVLQLWIITILLIRLQQPAAATHTVQRLNYGVLFTKKAQLGAAEQHWRHTFKLRLPTVPTTLHHLPEVMCNISNPVLCNQLTANMGMLNKLHLQANSIVINKITNIQALVQTLKPAASFQHSQRGRRSVLPFIGDLSKTLFGTATTKDVETLRIHMNELIKEENNRVADFQKHADVLRSYMSHTNDRLDNTIELIQTDHQAVSQLTSVLSTDVHLLATSLHRTTSLVANTTISLAILTSELDTLHQGLIHLLQDRLTSNIVPISVLKSTLMDITSHLTNSHPNLALTHPTVHYYYRHAAFVASLKNNAVFITLNLPVSPLHYKFTLFHVTILPVPVNHTSVHATQVVHVPAYIAIAQDQQSFIELTDEQYMQCEGDTIKHCPMLIAQQPLNKPTCLSSVFFQQTSDVTKVCDFHYLHNGLKTMVTRVDFKTLLLTNVSSLTSVHHNNQ